MKITEGNFLYISMKCYNNSSVNSLEEFNQDIARGKLIERQFKKYKKHGYINVRLLINHFICFNNVFEVCSQDLLKHIINITFHPQLNALLFVLNYLDKTEVELDEDMVKLISKEIK